MDRILWVGLVDGPGGWAGPLEATRHNKTKQNEQQQKHVKMVVKNEAGGRKMIQNLSPNRPKWGPLEAPWVPGRKKRVKKRPRVIRISIQMGSQNGAQNGPKTRQKNKRKKGREKNGHWLHFGPFWGAFWEPFRLKNRSGSALGAIFGRKAP